MLKRIIFIVVLIIIGIGAAAYTLLYTSFGSRETAEYFLSNYGDMEEDHIDSTGNIGSGITIRDLELDNLKGLPSGSKLRIQKLFVNVTSLTLDGLVVEIENARLRLPDSEPIVIMGAFQNQMFDLDIFSRGFTVNEVLSYLPDFKTLIPLKGEVNNVDLFIKGPYHEPEVTGTFKAEKFIYKGFTLDDSLLSIDLKLGDVTKDLKLFGRVMIDQGILRTQKVSVNIEPGHLDFSGPWNNPRFELKGKSKIEKTTININLRGTLDAPDLSLSSTPPYSKQKLMLMLATGKSWQSVENTLDSGTLSTDLTKDFIDYFFFAGKANTFARKFGVKEFTVTINSQATGVGARKDITDSLDIGFAVEKKEQENGESVVSQKIGSEYKMTDNISIGVEKEVIKEQRSTALEEFNAESRSDQKIYMEYKKEF